MGHQLPPSSGLVCRYERATAAEPARSRSRAGQSLERSDEQLAYYVAQAREVIDLSIMSQKEIVEELRQLPSRQAAAREEAARKKAAEGVVMTDDERRKLVSTEQSLGMDLEPKLASGLEAFTRDEREEKPADFSDADSFFNLPHGDDEDEEDDDDPRR